MKTTVSAHDFLEAFRKQRPEQFSRAALLALFDYLEEVERESASELELDVVAICCDYTEYATAVEAAVAYGWEEPAQSDDERADKSEEQAEAWLMDQTTVITFDGGVIVQNF